MFFWQRKFKSKTRLIRMRDEWGQLQNYEINIDQAEPTDRELQEQLQTTAVIRRLDE